MTEKPYINRRKGFSMMTKIELDSILAAHELFYESEGVKGGKANTSEANLYRANISKANLSKADLFKADLFKANLSEANLSGANLLGANLSGCADILQFSFGSWVGVYHLSSAYPEGNYLFIGCKHYPLSHWAEYGYDIAEKNKMDKTLADVYMTFIREFLPKVIKIVRE